MFKRLKCFGFLLAVVLFAYAGADAQIVDATKKVVDKTKDVTVDAAKKTVEVTKDVANTTKDATVNAAEKTGDAVKPVVSGTQKVGGYVIETTGDLAEKTVEGGKYFVTTTWDGAKWVSKKVWYPTKNAAAKTVKVVN